MGCRFAGRVLVLAPRVFSARNSCSRDGDAQFTDKIGWWRPVCDHPEIIRSRWPENSTISVGLIAPVRSDSHELRDALVRRNDQKIAIAPSRL